MNRNIPEGCISVEAAIQSAEQSLSTDTITIYGLFVSPIGEAVEVQTSPVHVEVVFTPFLLPWPVDETISLLYDDSSDYYTTNYRIYINHTDIVMKIIRARSGTWMGGKYLVKTPVLITGKIARSQTPGFIWELGDLESVYVQPEFLNGDDTFVPVSFEPVPPVM